ncbi:MAG: hypothetical protein V5A81_07345 [Candidatus Bipolaricaulota bacterium]|nr:hypothetical protein [Candidatus Bipolaricaulota bacterium]
MNSFEMEQLAKFDHQKLLRQGEEERLARKAIEIEARGRGQWAKSLLLFFLQG